MRKGLPTVVVVTGQFERRAAAIMRAQEVPPSIMILVEGNPEFVPEEVLNGIAERVLEESVAKLTGNSSPASEENNDP